MKNNVLEVDFTDCDSARYSKALRSWKGAGFTSMDDATRWLTDTSRWGAEAVQKFKDNCGWIEIWKKESGIRVDGQPYFRKVLGDNGLIYLVVKGPYTPDMPQDVLSGKLGEICNQRMGAYPRAYAWPALVTLASGLVVKGNGDTKANIYTAIVGPVHSGKTACTELAAYLLSSRESESLQNMKSGSIEGLLKFFQGVTHPLVLCPDELSHLLTKSKIDNATFESTLNSMFYQDEQNLTIARGKTIHCRFPLSILGGLVEEKFEDSFGSNAMTGLYDRFMFGLCPSDYQCHYREPLGEPSYRWAPDRERPILPKINGDVWEKKQEWLTRDKIGNRTAEIAIRVAATCAAFDGRAELKAKDLEPAAHLAIYQDNVRKILTADESQNQSAKVENKILRFLRRNAPNGHWVRIRDLKRCTHVTELYGEWMCARAVDALERSGQIQTKTRETGGRPSLELCLLELPDSDEE